MERRKRVELIMNSRLFREELERIIESQMRDGNNSAGLLQQISDMVGSKYSINNNLYRSELMFTPNLSNLMIVLVANQDKCDYIFSYPRWTRLLYSICGEATF